MKILKYLLLGLAALVAIVLVIGLFLPDSVHLEREIQIDAPPSTVFTIVNGYGRLHDWSPWTQIDPENTVDTFTGPAQGVGAKHTWQSDHPNVGNGSQEIIESTPYTSVKNYLDFGPQGDATSFFTLTPKDDGTHVVWGFDTEFGMDIMGRYFGLMMEKFIGTPYEEGLANLKALAEGMPSADFSDLDVEVTEVEPMTMAYFEGTSTQQTEQVSEDLASAYAQVVGFIESQGLTPSGPPLTVNHLWEDNVYEFQAGMPIAEAPEEAVAADSPVQIGTTYGGKAVRAVHRGSYDSMPETYEKLMAYMAAHGYEYSGSPWDIWISDPETTPEEDLITHIHFPLAGD